MRFIFTFLIALTMTVSAQAQFGKALGKVADKANKVLKGESPLSQSEISKGLKEALEAGVGEAVDKLSAENGYLNSVYKIEIPENAAKVISKVKGLPGMGNVEQTLINKMNQAAEIAAKKATPIFVSAITSMSIQDAMDILMGSETEATDYLEKSTRRSLFEEFQPVIQSSLDEVNARTYWKGVVDQYNKIPLVKDENPELDEYVTERALVGMFKLIAKKEEDIRKNQNSRTTDLLKKVFAEQDKK